MTKHGTDSFSNRQKGPLCTLELVVKKEQIELTKNKAEKNILWHNKNHYMTQLKIEILKLK